MKQKNQNGLMQTNLKIFETKSEKNHKINFLFKKPSEMVQGFRYYCVIYDPISKQEIYSCFARTFEELSNLTEPALKSIKMTKVSANSFSIIFTGRSYKCVKKLYGYEDIIKIYPVKEIGITPPTQVQQVTV